MLLPVPADIGYPALAGLVLGESAGLPLPGETALITAAGLAAAGHLDLGLVIVIAACAAIAGDTIGYAVGRRRGRAFLLRDGRFAHHRHTAVRRGDHFFARFGAATVFFARFLPGLRVVGALMAGATFMRYKHFAVANAAGAFVWAASVATVAHALGASGAFILAAAGLTGAGVATGVTYVVRSRRTGAELAPVPSSESP